MENHVDPTLYTSICCSEFPTWVMGPKNLIVALKSNFHISNQSQMIQDTLFLPFIWAPQESYALLPILNMPS